MKQKIGSIIAILLKSTKILKVLKMAKFLKPFITILTMALSVAAYSPLLGWYLAAMLIILIFIHELGHAFALKKYGHPMKWPLFIPMLGAVIFAPQMKDRNEEAYVGIGGPVLGTIGALLCLIPYYMTDQIIWLMGAILGVYLNAFNMIPISPLDGGRITQAVSKHFKWVGIALLLAFTLYSRDAGMLLIWVMVLADFSISHKWKFFYICILITAMFVLGFGLGFMSHAAVLWVDIGLALFFLTLEGLLWKRDIRDAKKDAEWIASHNEQWRKTYAEHGMTYEPFVRDEPEPPFESTRLTLPNNQRLGWLVAWTVLLAIHIATIAYLYPILLSLKK